MPTKPKRTIDIVLVAIIFFTIISGVLVVLLQREKDIYSAAKQRAAFAAEIREQQTGFSTKTKWWNLFRRWSVPARRLPRLRSASKKTNRKGKRINTLLLWWTFQVRTLLLLPLSTNSCTRRGLSKCRSWS